MNLKLMRLGMHMSAAQAARHLAATPDYPQGVSETTWNRWESGKKPLPADVRQQLVQIAEQQSEMLWAIIGDAGQEIVPPTLCYYSERPEHMSVLDYHLQLSVAVLAQALDVPVGDAHG